MSGSDPREFFGRLLSLAEEATAMDLGIVAGIILLALFINMIWRIRRVRVARNIPSLSIAGWGTRGKSGTERKKAALFHALGYEVLVKTTGCEAMIIHSRPGADPTEIFLYRPNDKASILEQAEVVGMSRGFQPDVFLWECMALSPDKVELLSRHWMRDTLATLTNTFPDHEDIQGPAGMDIPRVMTHFVPERGEVFTAEEQMVPVIAQECLRLGTSLSRAEFADIETVSPEVTRRFPYVVHPANLALVRMLGERLGVSRYMAYKEMAEHIVPDLGAFKTYPVVPYLGRLLEFSNGMSANERRGFLANWRRLYFHQSDLGEAPSEYIVLVINNRADRIARSRVFADVIVMDAPNVDLVVGIGTNLEGLLGYIEVSLDRRLRGIDLFATSAEDQRDPTEKLTALLREQRVPINGQQLRARLASFWTSGGQDVPQELLTDLQQLEAETESSSGALPEELRPFVATDYRRFVRGQELLERAQDLAAQPTAHDSRSAARQQLNDDVRSFVRALFNEKLHMIMDPGVSGAFIIDQIARRSPPGCRTRILGAQNIKGTGLDFMYRWVYYEQLQRAWTALENAPDSRAAEVALIPIEKQDIGVLEASLIKRSLPGLRARAWAADPSLALRLDGLRDRAELAREKFDEEIRRAEQMSVRRSNLARAIERLIEPTDAMFRRRRARRVFRDLQLGLVSHAQAAKLLKREVDRQKGGWFQAWLNKGRR